MNDATNFNGISSSETESGSNTIDCSTSPAEIPQDSQSSESRVIKETPSKKEKASTQNIDWQQLAHKLREHNRKLLKKVFNLEQNLIDATNQVQEHQEIARREELTITEQSEKLNQSQEEIADLLQEVEKERQVINNQQVLIQNLSLQLKNSQQQTTKLERESTVVQENYNQKAQELLSITAEKEELESRLYRQQQQTLQYKAAIEKYSAQEKPLEHLPSIKIPSRLKHQPIQPWSSASEELAVNNVLPTNPEVESSLATESSETSQKSDWRVPEIEKNTSETQPRSLAAVKLPKFQKINQ